jgi:hypothetical protein
VESLNVLPVASAWFMEEHPPEVEPQRLATSFAHRIARFKPGLVQQCDTRRMGFLNRL